MPLAVVLLPGARRRACEHARAISLARPLATASLVPPSVSAPYLPCAARRTPPAELTGSVRLLLTLSVRVAAGRRAAARCVAPCFAKSALAFAQPPMPHTSFAACYRRCRARVKRGDGEACVPSCGNSHSSVPVVLGQRVQRVSLCPGRVKTRGALIAQRAHHLRPGGSPHAEDTSGCEVRE